MHVSLPAVVLSAAALSLTAQTAAAPAVGAKPTEAAPTTPGAMSAYHSDALHLTYSYPAVYKDASATVGPALEASIGQQNMGTKDAVRCVTVPFSAMDHTSGQFSLMLLVRADGGCMKKKFTAEQLPEFTKGEVQGLTASGAHTQFEQPVAFTTQGRPAELLEGTFELPTGQALHALAVCMLLKPDVACWQFLASSEQSLRAMTAFPVALEGGQPEPLVPANILAKP